MSRRHWRRKSRFSSKQQGCIKVNMYETNSKMFSTLLLCGTNPNGMVRVGKCMYIFIVNTKAITW
jgi:hypothetical protein